MSVAASINILLRGNTKDLESKLAIVEKKFRAFAGMFSGVTSAFSTEALKAVFEEVVQLGRVADRLDIIPEKLAGLRLAADAAGVDFGELTSAIQKMLVAVSGSGDPLKKAAAATAFQKLGISAASLKHLAPEQQLAAIADALAKVQNVADRVNIAKSIFGKGGVPILNVLRDGSKALNAWQKAAEDAGLALNKVEVGKFERAEQTFKVLAARMKGAALTILVELVPRLEWLGKVMISVSKVILDFFSKWGQQIKWIIQLWLVYKAVQWTVIAAERAKAAILAVNAVLEDVGIKSIQAKIAAFVILGLAAANAAVQINNAFDKLAEGVTNIHLPELGKLEGVDMDALSGSALAKHPAALIKGSVEAYSAIVNAGGSLTGKIEQHTKQSAKSLQNIERRGGQSIAPANLGGRG